jgi:K+-transporting ATPase KdpF subunit
VIKERKGKRKIMENMIIALVAIGLIVYLFATLLCPEKF